MTTLDDPRVAPGAALVPASATVGGPDATSDVVGTVHMVDGELVVRLRPSQVRDVTTRAVHRHYRGCACRTGGRVVELDGADYLVGGLGYVGPMTPADRAQFHAAVAWWDARPWWRRRWIR